MVRISQIGLCALLVLLVTATLGHSYVATYGDLTTYSAGGACPPGGCPPPGLTNPMAGYGIPQQMPPYARRQFRKVKPITKCKPNYCPPPMCAPDPCAPMPCGPIGCAPMMCKPPVKWY
jgi:hypothetical protein